MSNLDVLVAWLRRRVENYPAPGRIIVFLLVLILLWLPGASIIYGYFIETEQNLEDPGVKNLLTIFTGGLLGIEFIAFLPWWGRRIYGCPNIFHRYGLVFSKENGFVLLKGLTIGFALTFSLFITQGLFGWLTWRSPSLPIYQLFLEGSATALGVGLAEELCFRGWMLDELEQDYSQKVAATANAGLFAVSHFLKPIPVMLESLPQFPGLYLFATVLVIAKRKHRHLLGISIGLHAGMVWCYYIIKVGNMVKYSGSVSEWLTGINGNPLSGLLGIIFLSVFAIFLLRLPAPIEIDRTS
jgi:uncharacterized protein